jgi:predicted RNA-binding Zn ribbon-like protein
MSTPWAIEVDGVRLPKQLSGHPALELCNSRAGWQGAPGPRGDYLQSYDALALLAVTTGVITSDAGHTLRRMAAGHVEAAAGVLDRIRSIRTDLYTALTGEPSRAALRRLSAAISAAHSRQRIVLENDCAHWTFGSSPALVDPLDAFLVAAGDLLVDERRKTVAACPGEDCGWLFLNASGRRRWCQMAVCGNRAKQTSFAQRTHHPAP